MYGMCRDNKLKSLKTVELNVEYFPLTSFDLSLEVKNCFIKNSIDLENSGLFILKEQTNCNCSSETWFIAAKYISANTLFSLQLSLDPIMCRQKKKKKLRDNALFLTYPTPPPPLHTAVFFYIMNHKQKAPELGQHVHQILSTQVLREKIAGVLYIVAGC